VTTRPQRQPAPRDILAGSIFLVIGLAFAIGATSYDLGTPARMGPGAFPFVLGGLLAIFGGVTIAKGLVAGETDPIGLIPWRAIVLVVGAILFFGATVRGLGLVPSLFVSILLTSLASRQTRIVMAVAIATGLTALCVLIFVVALQLRLSLLGPWLGGV
jgi:hypothetical protein